MIVTLRHLIIYCYAGIMSHVMAITNSDARFEFNTLHITAVVSPDTLPPGQTQLVSITVITDISKYVQTRNDEIYPALGIQFQPDGLRLKAPITITIPHCALLDNSEDVCAVLYSGSGQIGMCLLIKLTDYAISVMMI